jgi:hypothetical protein
MTFSEGILDIRMTFIRMTFSEGILDIRMTLIRMTFLGPLLLE